jgi:hypothetical protein
LFDAGEIVQLPNPQPLPETGRGDSS